MKNIADRRDRSPARRLAAVLRELRSAPPGKRQALELEAARLERELLERAGRFRRAESPNLEIAMFEPDLRR